VIAETNGGMRDKQPADSLDTIRALIAAPA
jgi:hypothetical protein